MFFTVTLAPGTTAPVASVTVPIRAPRNVCDWSRAPGTVSRHKREQMRKTERMTRLLRRHDPVGKRNPLHQVGLVFHFRHIQGVDILSLNPAEMMAKNQN